jgi:hypothetical protein
MGALNQSDARPSLRVIARKRGLSNNICHGPRMRATQVSMGNVIAKLNVVGSSPWRSLVETNWVARIRGP